MLLLGHLCVLTVLFYILLSLIQLTSCYCSSVNYRWVSYILSQISASFYKNLESIHVLLVLNFLCIPSSSTSSFSSFIFCYYFSLYSFIVYAVNDYWVSVPLHGVLIIYFWCFMWFYFWHVLSCFKFGFYIAILIPKDLLNIVENTIPSVIIFFASFFVSLLCSWNNTF